MHSDQLLLAVPILRLLVLSSVCSRTSFGNCYNYHRACGVGFLVKAQVVKLFIFFRCKLQNVIRETLSPPPSSFLCLCTGYFIFFPAF